MFITALSEFRNAIVAGFVWLAAARLIWLWQISDSGSPATTIAEMFQAADRYSAPSSIAILFFTAWIGGESWIHIRIHVWAKISTFVIVYLPKSRIARVMLDWDPLEFFMDHCLSPSGRYSELFPTLGFQRPDRDDLNSLERFELREVISSDIECAMAAPEEASTGITKVYDRRVGGYHFGTSLAFPLATLTCSFGLASGFDWVIWAPVALLLWVLTARIAVRRHQGAFAVALNGVASGRVSLPTLTKYGLAKFGPVPDHYRPYQDRSAMGAALRQEQSGNHVESQ